MRAPAVRLAMSRVMGAAKDPPLGRTMGGEQLQSGALSFLHRMRERSRAEVRLGHGMLAGDCDVGGSGRTGRVDDA